MKWNDVFFNTFRAIREKTTAKVRKSPRPLPSSSANSCLRVFGWPMQPQPT